MPSFNISEIMILKLYLTASQTGTSAWLSWWVDPEVNHYQWPYSFL